MDNKKSGLSICGVLALIFTVLKLVGVIDWSWEWVLSPIWIPWLIGILCYAYWKIRIWIDW